MTRCWHWRRKWWHTWNVPICCDATLRRCGVPACGLPIYALGHGLGNLWWLWRCYMCHSMATARHWHRCCKPPAQMGAGPPTSKYVSCTPTGEDITSKCCWDNSCTLKPVSEGTTYCAPLRRHTTLPAYEASNGWATVPTTRCKNMARNAFFSIISINLRNFAVQSSPPTG